MIFTKKIKLILLSCATFVLLTVCCAFCFYQPSTANADEINATDLFASKSDVTIEQKNGVNVSSDNPYNATIKGVFKGDTTLRFKFSEIFEGDKNTWYDGNFVVRVTDADDDGNYFEVKYSKNNTWTSDSLGVLGYTGAHVYYGSEVRSSKYWAKEGVKRWLDSDKSNDNAITAPYFRNATNDHLDGILKIIIDENGVLSVEVNHPTNDNYTTRVIAAFDGTNEFEADVSWGLPKLNFENGYVISFSSSFSNEKTTDRATDVTFTEIAGVSLYGADSVDVTYKYNTYFENATVKGLDVYIPQNERIGKITGEYMLSYAGNTWFIKDKIEIPKEIDTSKTGITDFIVVDGLWKNTPLGEVNNTYKIHVEEPYTLAFDTNGGKTIDSIVYSENTKNRITVGDAEKTFWKFDGWYLNDNKWSENLSDLYGKNVTLVAKWKDVENPTIRLNGINDVTYYLKGSSISIAKSDIVAADAAQNESIVIGYEVKKPSQTGFSSVEDGYELSLDEFGTYVVRYTVTDAAGLSSACERNIEVFDRNAPIITVENQGQTSTYIGLELKFAAVTAKNADGDALDVEMTVVKDGKMIETNSNVSFLPTSEGEYIVTFTAKDKEPYEDLISSYFYKFVVLADDVAPTIGDEFVDMRVTPNTIVVIPTITITDNVSKNIDVTIKAYFGTKEINLSDNSFVATDKGVYKVVIVAVDEAGNQSEKTVSVTVEDEIENANSSGRSGCSGSLFVETLIAFLIVVCCFISIKIIKKKNKKY